MQHLYSYWVWKTWVFLCWYLPDNNILSVFGGKKTQIFDVFDLPRTAELYRLFEQLNFLLESFSKKDVFNEISEPKRLRNMT